MLGKFIAVFDLHGSNERAGAMILEAQDDGDFRVYLNWKEKVDEIVAVANAEKVDGVIVGGDTIDGDSTDADKAALLQAIYQRFFDGLTPGTKLIPVFGNHDRQRAGLTVNQVTQAYVNVYTDASIAGDVNTFPSTIKVGDIAAFINQEVTGLSIIVLWGATETTDNTMWDTGGIEYDTGKLSTMTQLSRLGDWLTTAGTDKVLVVMHEHLNDEFGLAPTSVDNNIDVRTLLGEHTQKVTVLGGHYHRVVTVGLADQKKETLRTLPFDTGDGAEILGRNTVTGAIRNSITGSISGATADVHSVDLASGAWETDAAGNLHLLNQVDEFQTNDRLIVSGTERCTATAGSGMAVDYHTFRGSTLGKFATDFRNNTFVLFGIDDAGELVNSRIMKYSDTPRDRYAFNDLDEFMGTQSRGRR